LIALIAPREAKRIRRTGVHGSNACVGRVTMEVTLGLRGARTAQHEAQRADKRGLLSALNAAALASGGLKGKPEGRGRKAE
jgi:hypothetical protein